MKDFYCWAGTRVPTKIVASSVVEAMHKYASELGLQIKVIVFCVAMDNVDTGTIGINTFTNINDTLAPPKDE